MQHKRQILVEGSHFFSKAETFEGLGAQQTVPEAADKAWAALAGKMLRSGNKEQNVTTSTNQKLQTI